MKQRLTAAMMAILLALALLPMGVQAAGSYATVINTSRLNVRSGPGMEYPIVGFAPRGEWVEINASTGVWYQGRVVSTGISGYMNGNYLSFSGGGGGTPGSQAVVNNPVPSQFLNLRQYPSYSAPVLGIYYNGAVATVISSADGWYYVEIDGQRGYFRGEFLSFTGGGGGGGGGGAPGSTATVHSSNGGRVNLRSGPGYDYNVIGSFAPGTVVTVYSREGRFWFVSAHGASGYMDRNFLRDGSIPYPPSPPGPAPIPGTTNAIVTPRKGSLNLREQASTSSRVVGSYPGNTAVNVTKQGLTWCRVSIPSAGTSGYMMTRYLTLYGLPAVPTLRVRHPQRSYVNLRTSPSQAYGNVTLRVPHGSTVTVLTPGGEWTQVRYEGRTGYMMSHFLK
ncbi:MAG: SH3 domain-containing protein [Christensenellales bacterium]|jgi:uncharacterized protein YgiM (DUF1202 family)